MDAEWLYRWHFMLINKNLHICSKILKQNKLIVKIYTSLVVFYNYYKNNFLINKVIFHIKNKKFNFEIIKLLADSPIVSRTSDNIWQQHLVCHGYNSRE